MDAYNKFYALLVNIYQKSKKVNIMSLKIIKISTFLLAFIILDYRIYSLKTRGIINNET